LYKEALDEQLPRGKFQGRTLRYIKENESWYYDYILEQGLLMSWNLLIDIGQELQPKKKEYNMVYSHSYGGYLLDMFIVYKNQLNAGNNHTSS